MSDRACRLALGAIIALVATGCKPDAKPPGEGAQGAASSAISACVSIPPQAYFVERIGGERVSVEVLVGEGQSPATYEPTPSQMGALDAADLFFRIGVPFEDALMDRIAASLPDLNVVDLRRGIDLRPIGGRGAGHKHARMDPHTWLDPDLAADQARTIHDELARLDPAHAQTWRDNLDALLADLSEVDEQVAETLAPLQNRKMLVFHPAFGYFADAYGLEQVAIEIEGKEPAPRELEKIIQLARSEGFRTIFAQPQFASPSVRAVAREIGAEVVYLDPLARDYLQNLREMADRVRAALERSGGAS